MTIVYVEPSPEVTNGPQTVWNPKRPDETVAYSDDWAGQLGSDSIASYVVTSDGTATIADQSLSGSTITLNVSGGGADTTTTFVVTVTTTLGQVLVRAYSLLVAYGVHTFRPTTTTKRMLIEQMFTECALNGWEYDIDPAEKQNALTRVDMLMWELRGRGLDLGYNFPAGIGMGDLDDTLGCPDQAFYGLAVLGAERLCPTMGKTQSRETRLALNAAMKALRNATTLAPTMNLAPGTPVGSGNKPWSTRFPFALT